MTDSNHPSNHGLCSVTTRPCNEIFCGKGFGAHVVELNWCRGDFDLASLGGGLGNWRVSRVLKPDGYKTSTCQIQQAHFVLHRKAGLFTNLLFYFSFFYIIARKNNTVYAENGVFLSDRHTQSPMQSRCVAVVYTRYIINSPETRHLPKSLHQAGPFT